VERLFEDVEDVVEGGGEVGGGREVGFVGEVGLRGQKFVEFVSM